jgi:hypothetical protein
MVRSDELSAMTAADFPLPPEMVQWFAELDAAGKDVLDSCSWWQTLKREPGWVQNWPSNAKNMASNDSEHRKTAPLHFVMGRMSPFYIERVYSPDCKRAVWACYFGPYTSNGGDTMGVGQGGAVSSVFDLITAQLGGIFVRGRTPTVKLEVVLKKAALPIPGCMKLEAWVVDQGGGDSNRFRIMAELGDGKPLLADWPT